MRSLTALLQSAQQLLNRAPNSRVIIRDVFLRLSELTSSAYATTYPSATLSGIPQCPIDFEISGGDAWRAWMKNSHLYLHCASGPLPDIPSWAGQDDLLVEDCEDVWNYSSSGFMANSLETTIKKVGSGSNRIHVYAPVPNGSRVAENFTAIDLSGYTKVLAWVRSSVNRNAGEWQLLLDDTNDCASPLETLNLPALTANTWVRAELALSNPAALTAVISVGLKYVNDLGVCYFYVDDIRAEGDVEDIVLNTTHRPSLEGAKVYYADPTAEEIYTRALIAGAVGAEVSFSDMPNMESKVALAAVASGCYLAELVESGTLSDFKYLQISKVKGGGGGFGSDSPSEYAGAGTTDGGAGAAWANPGNIAADDNTYASADLPSWRRQSEVLQARSFGFDIPARSTIKGVEVAIGKYATWSTEGYRKSVTITWNVAVAADRWPVRVAMDTQTPIGAGKMQADCSDLIVVVDNEQVDRWIVNPNNVATAIWFNLDFPASIGVHHTIHIYYDGEAAQAADDDYKPMFELASSTNSSWDYDSFDYWGQSRAARWTKGYDGAGPGVGGGGYGGNHGGGAATPYAETGIHLLDLGPINLREYWWKVYNPCGISAANFSDGEYNVMNNPGGWAVKTITIESSPDNTNWTVEATINPVDNDAWHAWTSNPAITAGAKYIRVYFQLKTTAGDPGNFNYCENDDATLTINTPPTIGALGAEENTPNTPVRDKTIQLVKTGSSGNNKAATGTNWPQNSEAETTYGGAADLWGLALSVAEVNHNDFGVDIAASVSFEDADAYVDYVEITVTYQPNADTSPHAIVVDPDYTQASMSWFDAVTLGSKDVIVISQRAYGDPVVMFYEDGAWSDPQPMLPADIVDNYTFLRISGMTVITDSDGDDVIWACGRIGRGGSSGLNSQEWDCVLRSKDGEHWTLDRYQYLCQNSKRGRLQVDGSYAFYPNGASVMYGKRTWLMGHDHADLKWTITDDLAGWQLTQGGVSQPATATTIIADHDGDYKPYKSGGVRYGIWAGYWLWRYAGFNGYEALLSTEGLDRTPGGYKAGDRKLQLVSRDIVMRQLIDWASDQDWQWLSQQKLYDDCDQMDHLYSVSGTQIAVTSGDLTGQVDQEEMITTAANELVYETINNEGIFIATKPAECRNYVVGATFRYLTNTNGRNLALGGSPQYLGFGFGVIGSAHGVDPAFNVVAAYYDTKTDKLYLLQRTGDTGSSTWAQLAVSADLAGSASENQRNRIELHRDGPNFTARILRFTQGSDATELAKVEYTWAVTDWICDQADDRGRVGVICNMDVTSGVGTEAIYITDVQAYDGDDPDKALEWTLEDIAAKAGVMSFETAYSVDEDPFTGDDNPAAAVWLQDTDGVDLNQRDFDLTFTLPNQIQDGDSLVVIAKASSKLAVAPVDGSLGSFSGCKITYLRSGTEWKVQFHQTTANPASATKHDWVKIDEMTFNLSVDDTAGGKRVRVVGYDDFYAIYINNRWVRTFHLGPVFDHIDDGYDSTMKGAPGYIGVWRVGATNWEAMTVTQPELWTWTDGIIMDQRMNALAGMMRTIRDRRVYFLPRADGTLKISQFSTRDTLQSLGDQIYEDADAPTDRVATHVRVVGEEISDYVDHSAAADWGITFALAQCPSLAEKEGYAEAQKITSDSISRALGRQMSHAARVDWEPEDKIPVAYAPCDGGPSVSDDYVVTAVVFSYRLGDLTSHATLREDR